ncbi:MAG: thioredoxin domain-containing protein [Polyangiales bacterium]|nr:thioredoxin domain-containing protein [Myxococcales bacterium]
MSLATLLALSTSLGGPSALARRAAPRTPSEVYESHAQGRLRVDASSTASRGPADAPITLVVFAELEDPFIARAQPTLAELETRYGSDLRVVFRHRPLDMHAHSRDAARALQEALAQGGPTWFWAMHDRLLGSQSALDVESLVTHARELGLDEVRFRAALTDGRHDAVIAADEAAATRVGATGSPTFFVNGMRLSGAQPLAAFTQLIDAELALANEALSRGATRQDIYRLAMAAAAESPAPPPTADAAPTDDDVYRVPVGRDQPIRGAADALVTIVVFSDFQCPFCARVNPTLSALEQRYGADLRVVFRHTPLPFHQNAMPAAQAAVEAYVQRGDAGFWAMHDLLFANQRALDRPDLEGYARQLGLDMTRFNRALDRETHRARVEADVSAGAALGVRGTPNFFVNGRHLVGAQPEAAFVELVDRGLAEARAAVRAGTSRRQVYARLIRDGRTAPPEPAPTPGARPTVDPNLVYNVPVTSAQPVRGRNDALVTLVVFTDFECPFCSRLRPTLDSLVQQYGRDLRVVLRHNPLPFHTHARLAAEAAAEAFAQGGDDMFFRYHDLLFDNQRALTRADLESYAQQLGLDMARFRQALDNHTHAATIDADQALAQQLGATGTPSIFVNGKLLRGAQPLSVFQTRVDAELIAARALLRRGVSRNQVYARTVRGGLNAPPPTP